MINKLKVFDIFMSIFYNNYIGGKMKKYISEFIGTFALTFFGCGVAVVIGCDTPAGIIATSLAFGLVIISMAYSIGNVSGCHINPAVSIAFLLSKKLSIKEFIGYVLSQIIGALAGSAMLGAILGSFDKLGANGFGSMLPNGNEVTVWVALVMEIVLTFFFVLTILGVTSKKGNDAASGIVIGLSLVLIHLIGISVTGTSVNPARSLAPALLQGGEALKQVWVFIVAPLIGGILAALVNKSILED